MSQWQKLYNTTAWRKKRRALLDSEPLCRMCKAMGKITVATVADHIKPHRGDLELFYHGELQSLCALCHNGAKAAEEASGLLRGGDIKGMPLDSGHHWNK